ncbi:hypothetical protein HPB50_014960 [Hyalomma asiaticum]|uniref:Uncharacterized protein n=1 Tax=Hyalomma asiaticum TaxID=266040 RepID=A0ACB7S1L1_HYAAI|nr:hypothetical protein HPB50_014960 [Hyalomma asiaticum]
MEGPLSVWTSFISGWHLCWVVLNDRSGMLYRFKSHRQRRQRIGLLAKFSGINLLGAIVTKDPREPTVFSVVSEGREYRFQAPSEEERDAWVMELEEAVLRQMVSRRAYHIWDRRYIGPTLALVNAKLQDAGLLYEELACSLQEMILPGLLAQLDTMQPRKKAATMLSLLRTQAAGLAVDPISLLLGRNPEPTAEGSALLEPALRSSRCRLHHPLSEMAHYADHVGYASRFDASGRRSPSTSERTGTRSLPTIRSPCSGSGQQPINADNSSSHTVSDSAGCSAAHFVTAVSNVDHSASVAAKALAGPHHVSIIKGRYCAADESSDTGETSTPSVAPPADHRWQVETVLGRGRAMGSRSPSKRHTRTPPLPLMIESPSRIWEEPAGPTARNLAELCSSLPFGEGLLNLDYPMSLLQKRSCLQALADLFACPEVFAEIGSSPRASERMLRALRWYLASIYYVKRGDDVTKPLEPVLGETHRCSWPLRCGHSMGDLQYAAEQVSPEAFSVGSYIQVRLHGNVSVYVSEYSEEYVFELPPGCIRNVGSKPWFEFCGVVNVTCHKTGYYAKIKFMSKPPMPGSKRHSIQADVYNPALNRPFVRLHGRWVDNVTASWASGTALNHNVFSDIAVLLHTRHYASQPNPVGDSRGRLLPQMT